MNPAFNWAKLRLEDLLARTETIAPAHHPDKEFELWSVPAFPTGRPEIVRGKNIGSSKQTVLPGDVLLCKINPRINRVWKIGKKGHLPQIASTEWIVLRSQHVDPDFLMYRLRESGFRDAFCTDLSGIGGSLTRARPQIYRGLTFSIPNLSEQKRIADVVRQADCRTISVRSGLESIPELIAELRRSVLAAALRGDLTADWRAQNSDEVDCAIRLNQVYQIEDRLASNLPDGWYWSTIGDLFEVNVGSTPRRNDPSLWNGGIPWVSSGEVAFNRICSTRETVSAAALKVSSVKLNPAGTVLLGMIGEGRTRGQAAILDIAACNNQNAAAILVSKTAVPPEFVYYWLEFRYEQTRGAGSGNNQPALNKSRVQAIEIPVPPIAEQQEIAKRTSALLKLADLLESRMREISADVDQLEKSILTKAFRGELVPQDPDDEPASVLLERIRAERAGGAAARPRRGRRAAAKP